MKRKYDFTPETFDRCKHDHFVTLVDELSKIEPITPWEEIKVGDVFHLPNLILYKRADFIVTDKNKTYMSGMIREDNGNWKNHSLFKNEVRCKFLVKKIKINKD